MVVIMKNQLCIIQKHVEIRGQFLLVHTHSQVDPGEVGVVAQAGRVGGTIGRRRVREG